MQGSRLTKSNLCSPIKNQTYQQLEDGKKKILKKLNYLFIVYASKASRYAYREMSQKCFMELIEHAYQSAGRSLLKNHDNWKKINHLYYGKGRKTGLTFQQFLKTLPLISSQFFHSNDPEDDLKYLMKHLQLVYDNKVAKQIQRKYVLFDPSLTKDTSEYIGKLANQLYIVYKLYFSQQIMKQQSNEIIQHQIFEKIILFFKEFEIYPKIISASQLYLIFIQTMENNSDNMFSWADSRISTIYDSRSKITLDKGAYFTFSKFISVIVRVGVTGVTKFREVENPEWGVEKQKESVKALLEYMENIKTKNKNSKFKHVRFSFILLEEYNEEYEKLMKSTNSKYTSKSQDFFDLFQRMKL